MLTTIYFVYPVVDVSAQRGCTITPISPTTLTAAGGVLAIGTENVTIQCNNCRNGYYKLDTVRWYDPDGNRLPSPANYNEYVPDAPHFTRVDSADDDIILVIPKFNVIYDGMYTCGERLPRGQLPGSPIGLVNLIIDSKLWLV